MATARASKFCFFSLLILCSSSDVYPYQDSKRKFLEKTQKDLVYYPYYPTTPSIVTVTPNPNSATPVTIPVTNPVTTPSQPITNPVTTFPAPATVNPLAGTGGSWCVAKSGVPESVIQAGIDYACGIGGADCSMIQEGGSCYDPNSIQNHGSYAFNSYYQKNPGQSSCDFGGAAMLTNVNPSVGSCIYPSSAVASTTYPGLGTSTSPMVNYPAAGGVPTIFGGINPNSISSSSSLNTKSQIFVIGFIILLNLSYYSTSLAMS